MNRKNCFISLLLFLAVLVSENAQAQPIYGKDFYWLTYLFRTSAKAEYSLKGIKVIPGQRTYKNGVQYDEYFIYIEQPIAQENSDLLFNVSRDFALNVLDTCNAASTFINAFLNVNGQQVNKMKSTKGWLQTGGVRPWQGEDDPDNIAKDLVFKAISGDQKARLVHWKELARCYSTGTNRCRLWFTTYVHVDYALNQLQKDKILQRVNAALSKGGDEFYTWKLKKIKTRQNANRLYIAAQMIFTNHPYTYIDK